MNKKHFHKFLLVLSFLLFSTTFFCLPIAKVFALQLNVDYPALPNGPGITAQSNVPEYLKYVFDMGMFVGMVALIFSLAIAGIFYFISPAIPSALAKAKDRVFGAFSGFLILLSVYLIVTTINPNLSFFYVTPISHTPVEPITTPPPPGVYLYQTTSCSSPPDPAITLYSVEDLKNLKGKIKSAKIVQDYRSDTYYISLLYESVGFWKKCFFIDPNSACNRQIQPFASSVSVYKYNHYPSAGGIIFYREPFYDSTGGSFQVSGSETSGIYIRALKDLKFVNNIRGNPDDPNNCTVPKEKQECVLWDEFGVCTKRKCPDLSGGNVGSIKINGNYVVLFIYFGPDDASKGPWSICQSFPSLDDKIGMGPNKIKWENIENQSRIPNYVLIFPVMDNTSPEETILGQ